MLINIIKFLFSKLIGNLPDETKRKFWLDFNDLLREVAKAAAEGATRGIVNKSN